MLSGKPTFLCIGAQKAGTTWLHETLARHPDIWLPPVKELHVLDHKPPPIMKRLFGQASHHRLARKHLRDMLLWGGRNPQELMLAWQIAFGRRDWAWYSSLFSRAGEKVAGEICPGYARLEETTVAELASRYPHLKIIYMLRDPVDRAWSSIAMHFRKDGRGLVIDLDREAILRQLLKPKAFAHCNYRRNIEIWSRYFGETQIYFGFFERIKLEPYIFLKEIMAFLGIVGEFTPRNLEEPVNQGRGEKLNVAIERDLASLLLPEAEYLHRRFGNAYTAQWLHHALRFAEVSHAPG